jgi:hypothetical protein
MSAGNASTTNDASHAKRSKQLATNSSNTKTKIRNAADFDELLAIIANVVRDVHRTGELYAYDTALRISYHLDLLPTRVYLHAGTRAGARALHLPHNNESINASDLPPEPRHRPAHEVEDILCIYKEHFTSE